MATVGCETVPKQVDHEQRRREIAAALWRVVGARGVEAVSLRAVAAEAGVSMGLVQHYFHTRDEMLSFAMDTVAERVAQRYAAEVSQLPQPLSPRAAVRALLVQFLPGDEAARLEGHALLGFLIGGPPDDPLAERLRDGMRQLREFVGGQIAEAGLAADPETATTALLGLTDGLAVHVMGGYVTSDAALAALDTHLESVFGLG